MTQVQSVTLLSPEVSAMLNGLLAEVLLALGDDPRGADLSIRRVTSLLQTLSTPQLMAPAGGLAAWQCNKVRIHIDGHIDARLSTVELATLVRLSASHFARAFKISFGCAPHAYVISRRVARAKDLLLNSNIPLCEIALMCGMADQAHLSRLFRRAAGKPPSAWRRQYTTPANAA